MAKHKLMIFGARKKSLGEAIKKMWQDQHDWPVVTVGYNGEDENIVIDDAEELEALFKKHEPTRVVCTIGMNEELADGDLEVWMMDHLRTNIYLPIHILMTWMEAGAYEKGGHFVAISSNSAHIPRSKSMAYGASKAGLSMALRCAARDLAKAEFPLYAYGYEPGLIKGTPMSGERGGTRMLGAPQGISRRTLASQIVHNLVFGGPELNGVLMRIDAGEV